MRRGIIAAVLMLIVAIARAAELKVDSVDGGSVITELSSGIKVNEGSSLHRTFVTINDISSPVQLQGSGIIVTFENSRYSFAGHGNASAAEALSAFEVRHVLFGMFGERIKTLSAEEVRDLEKASSFYLGHEEWNATEGQVSDLLTVVSFVASVRTASGRVWHCDLKKISEAIGQLNLSLGSESKALDAPSRP